MKKPRSRSSGVFGRRATASSSDSLTVADAFAAHSVTPFMSRCSATSILRCGVSRHSKISAAVIRGKKLFLFHPLPRCLKALSTPHSQPKWMEKHKRHWAFATTCFGETFVSANKRKMCMRVGVGTTRSALSITVRNAASWGPSMRSANVAASRSRVRGHTRAPARSRASGCPTPNRSDLLTTAPTRSCMRHSADRTPSQKGSLSPCVSQTSLHMLLRTVGGSVWAIRMSCATHLPHTSGGRSAKWLRSTLIESGAPPAWRTRTLPNSASRGVVGLKVLCNVTASTISFQPTAQLNAVEIAWETVGPKTMPSNWMGKNASTSAGEGKSVLSLWK